MIDDMDTRLEYSRKQSWKDTIHIFGGSLGLV